MPGLAATRMQQTSASRGQTVRRGDGRELRRSPADGARITSIEAYIADRRKREERPAFVETVLRQLARHRIGSDDVARAFEPDELRRIRSFLALASEAKSRVVRARRKEGSWT